MMTRLFAALTIATLAISPACADETKLPRTIAVNGTGEVLAVPDLATITLGVMSSAATAQEALATNTKSMSDVMALLKKEGIEDRDVSTSNFNIAPRYDYGQGSTQTPKVMGYDVSNTVTVKVRKSDALGDLLDKAVTAGSNQVYGISFSVSKPDAMLDEARKAAVADAKRKAEIYAAAGGFALSGILSVSEGTSYRPPMPMAMKATMAADAAPVPMSPGEQALSVDVSIVWMIK